MYYVLLMLYYRRAVDDTRSSTSTTSTHSEDVGIRLSERMSTASSRHTTSEPNRESDFFEYADHQQEELQAGEMLPHWNAPELLLNSHAYTHGSDVYAFAMVLFEIFSKKIPYYDLESLTSHPCMSQMSTTHGRALDKNDVTKLVGLLWVY